MKPDFDSEDFLSGDYSESITQYISDQFPLREQFIGLNAYFDLASGRNGMSGIYAGKDGYLITAPSAENLGQARTNLQRFEEFSESTGLPASLIIVPETGYIMSEKLPSNTKTYHDEEVFSLLKEECRALTLIDIREEFQQAKESIQLYYKTDHHLTSAGSCLLYQIFCQETGITPATFAKSESYDGFYGTTYTRSALWNTSPDTLEIYFAEAPDSYQVTIENGTSSEEYHDLYFREHLSEMDKYPVFLNGNHPVVKIKNTDCQNEKRLLLVKDSFAHCFSTFAIQNYEEICMVDLRYFRGNIKELVQDERLNQLLFLYGMDNFLTSTDTLWLM